MHVINQRMNFPRGIFLRYAGITEKQRARAPEVIKVALIAPSLRELIGGQEVQADLLRRYWTADSNVTALFVPKNPRLPDLVSSVPMIRTLVRLPIYLVRLFSTLKESHIAHIFSADYTSFLLSTVPAYCVARLLGRKVLINYHSGLAQQYLRTSWLARQIVRKANMVVTPSMYLVEQFREFDIAAKHIANVVDRNQFVYRRRSEERPIILCTRNFEKLYRVDHVVRAFAVVQKQIPEATLRLIGVGSLGGQLRDLVHELNLRNVEFLGRVTREDIALHYERANIFLNASEIDNMPVSIIEAFASGLPVVSTNAGGIRFLVEHGQTGLLTEVGDWRGLARNILLLVDDETLKERLTQNAFDAASRFEWSTIRESWYLAYLSLIDK